MDTPWAHALQRVVRLVAALAVMMTVLALQASSALATPQFGSGVSVGRNADGRLEAFASDYDGDLIHMWQLTGGGWSGWSEMTFSSQFALARPAVGRNPDGRLEVFAQSGTHMYHNYQLTGGGWSGWQDFGGSFLPGPFTAPFATNSADGRVEVFAVDTNGHLAHRYQLVGGGWSGWTDLGGSFNVSAVPAATLTVDGKLQVFMLDNNGAVVTKWQTAKNGTTWTSAWYSLGGDFMKGQGWGPAVGRNPDGRMEVFTSARSGRQLQHRWQTTPGGGWSGWASLGGAVDMPVVATNANGRLEVFTDTIAGPGGGVSPTFVRHISQLSSSTWGAWSDLSGGGPGTYQRPTVATNLDGRLEVFLQKWDGSSIYHTWQNAPSSSSWSAFIPLVAG